MQSIIQVGYRKCRFIKFSCYLYRIFRKLYNALRIRVTQLRFGIKDGTTYYDRAMEMNFAIDETVCSNADEALKDFSREARDIIHMTEAILLKIHCFMVSNLGKEELALGRV